MSKLYMILTVIALGAGVAGCGRNAGLDTGTIQPVAGAVAVHVVNNNFNDVDVYAVSEGVAHRLGTVTAASTSDFVMDPSYFPSGQLRLIAAPIGGNGRGSSGLLSVMAGQTIEFDVAPHLIDSMAVVR